MKSPPELHDVVVPAAEDGAVKPWRRRLHGLDESARGAFCCDGPWLDPGSTWRMPTGALIVGVDRTSPTSNRIRLWRVGPGGGLVVERDSTFKTPDAAFGPSVRTTLRTKLAKYPADLSRPAERISGPARVNEHVQNCARCGYPVLARAGLLTGDGERWIVTHQAGKCLKPWPNPDDAPCTHCRQTVAAGAGFVMPTRGEPAVAHPAGACPPKPTAAAEAPAARRNQRPGTCIRCAQPVAAGAGTLIDLGREYAVNHDGDCPPYPGGYTGPTWRINAANLGGPRQHPGRRWRDGEVVRVKAYATHPAVPLDAPGRRDVGTTGAVSFIGVVIAEHDPVYSRDEDGNSPGDLIGEDGWSHRGVVRVATAAEAAAMLDTEAAEAAEFVYRRRVSMLLGARADDAELPGADDLAAALAGLELHQVYVTEQPDPFDTMPRDRFYVAAEWPFVMVTVDNGADGDTWSASNYGSSIARLLPLTPDRAGLLLVMHRRGDADTSAVDHWLRGLAGPPRRPLAEAVVTPAPEPERAGGDAP